MAPRKYFFGVRGEALLTAHLWTVICFAFTLFGYLQAVAGALVSLPSFQEQFPVTSATHDTNATFRSNVVGTIVATYTLGCFFGALSCLAIGDPLGRVKVVQLGGIIHVIGAILLSTSYQLPQFVIGRFVAGLGLGMISATAPNWQSEISTAAHRGAAVIAESIFISAGLAIAGWLDLGFSFTSGSVQWRFPFAFSGIMAIITVVLASLFPESPRWLLKHGRDDEARDILSVLYDKDPADPSVQLSVDEIKESLAITGKGSFGACFRNGELRLLNRTVLACSAQAFQQLGGINALAFYLSTIFSTYLGLSDIQSRVVAASVFTFQTLCAPIGVLTVDRLGRRKLMLISALGMGSCMAIVAGCTSQGIKNKAAEAVAGAMIFLFSFFFPIGFLGMTFLYASEISPLNVRVQITALSTSSAWIFNFLVAEVTPTGFANIGWKYFIVYACINFFLIVPSVYLFFPETSGRHLEEVDQIFRDSSNIFQPVKVASQFNFRELREERVADAGEKAAVIEQEEK